MTCLLSIIYRYSAQGEGNMKKAFIVITLFFLFQNLFSENQTVEGQPPTTLNAPTPATNHTGAAPLPSETQPPEGFDMQSGESPGKKIVLSGNMTTGTEVISLRRNSPLFPVMFYTSPKDTGYLTSFYGNLILALDFIYDKIEFHYKAEIAYVYPDNVKFRLLEGINRINFNINTMLEAGIIRFKWGKGFAWNPVGFINPFKNLEDLTREYAGVSAIHFQYQKSLSGNALKNIAFNAVILPVIKGKEENYGKLSDVNYAAKLYFLLFNIDIDLVVFGGPNVPIKTGMDFSLNLIDPVEFHVELAYQFRSYFRYFNEAGDLQEVKKNTWSLLAGFTIKLSADTSLQLEYLYQSWGLKPQYFSYLLQSAQTAYNDYIHSGSSIRIESLKNYYSENFPSGFIGRHYIYFRIQEKDLFGITYFNPYFYLIINLEDKSMVLSPVLNYAPFQNLEINIFFVCMIGKTPSEFGSSYSRWKVGANLKIFF